MSDYPTEQEKSAAWSAMIRTSSLDGMRKVADQYPFMRDAGYVKFLEGSLKIFPGVDKLMIKQSIGWLKKIIKESSRANSKSDESNSGRDERVAFAKAFETFTKNNTDLSPSNALFEKGLSLNIQGKYKEAISSFDKGLKLSPGNTSLWMAKGDSLRELGRYEEAVHSYDQALKDMKIKVPSVWVSKGNCLNHLGRFEEAVHCYADVLENDPQNADAWYGRAFAEEKLGRSKDAVLSYKKFLALGMAKYSAATIENVRQRMRNLEGG